MASNCSSSAARHLAVVVFIFGILSQYHQLEATRDSQFFSKVTNSNSNGAKEQTTQPDSSETAATEEGHGLVYKDKGRSDQLFPTNNVDVSDTTTPISTKSNDESYNYQKEQASELDGTTDQGYPTTYNDKAYVTKPQGYTPNNNNNNKAYVTNPQGYTPNNNKYYNTNDYGSFENKPQDLEFSGTSLMDQSGHSTTYNNNDNGLNTYNPQEFSQEEKDAVLSYSSNNNYNGEGSYNVNNNNNNNNYNGEGSYNVNNNNNNNNNNGYNGQQEGMSDTRFLENGRYHYNVKTNQYNNNLPTYHYSRNNNYDNINANSYSYSSSSNNNNNYNSNYNSVEGYQNQSDENEELDSFNP